MRHHFALRVYVMREVGTEEGPRSLDPVTHGVHIGRFAADRSCSVCERPLGGKVVFCDKDSEGPVYFGLDDVIQRALGALRLIDAYQPRTVLDRFDLRNTDNDDLTRISDVEHGQHPIRRVETVIMEPGLPEVLIGLSFPQPAPENRDRGQHDAILEGAGGVREDQQGTRVALRTAP